MKQREEVLSAWKRYSEKASATPSLQKTGKFFDFIDQRTDLCWSDFLEEFRANYRDCTDDVVKTLVETNDPLILYNFIRSVNYGDPAETEAAKGFIQSCDADLHHASLWALTKVPQMHPELRKHPSLPAIVKSAITTKKTATK